MDKQYAIFQNRPTSHGAFELQKLSKAFDTEEEAAEYLKSATEFNNGTYLILPIYRKNFPQQP